MARLGQLTKTLNIGLSTAVEYLSKKNHKIEENPNLKLSSDQEELLLNEFGKGLNISVKPRAEIKPKVVEEPQVEAVVEVEKEEIKIEIPKVVEIKHVTKIDLDEVNGKGKKAETPKPVEQKVEEIKIEEPKVEESKVEKVIEKEAPKEETVVTEAPKVVKEPKQIIKAEAPKVAEFKPITKINLDEVGKHIPTAPKAEVAPVVVTESHDENKTDVFSIKRKEIKDTTKVIGKIDLDSINSSTRPAKKTKEEKKLQRIAQAAEKKQQVTDARKAAAAAANPSTAGAATDPNKKKKRQRIGGGERVNIDQATTYNNTNNNNSQFKKDKNKGNHKKNPTQPAVVDDDAVARQVKETLARLTEGRKGNKKAAQYRKDRREAFNQQMQDQLEQEQSQSSVLKLTEFVTANELAVMMDVPVTKVIGTCMSLGLFVSINQRLDAETIKIVADEFGYSTEFVSAEVVSAIQEEEDNEEDLVPRSPIVTVMGHVDHGKTSLLDYIRKANVIAGEAGGITQHIGAYNVKLDDGRRITFLDTPGHEAFTAMRARGAKVTDIAIIIVAADDNVMPQTIEAINHASAAGVPMIFAINKIDKPGANPEKIKETLAGMNYLVEEWGGKYQSQDIAAKQGLNINLLLEKVLLEAELLELKANPNRRASGSVIEASLDKGKGYVSTILVENGTLKIGDVVLAGTSYGRVKAMFNERNQRITSAGPAEPVIILGLNGAPQAGDNFNVFATDHEARDIANKREQLQREQGLRTSRHLTLDEIGRRIALGNFQELNIIVKGDVDGSIEALSDSLIKLSTPEIQVNVIHKAVGQISESDIMLAAASNAIIVGFQVRPSMAARRIAEKEEIDIRLYSVIYSAIEEVKSAMEGMLSPEIKENITATIEIREVFKISKVGTIAGCMVKEGKVKRGSKIRLIRDGIVVFTGELASLKRMKEDVKEVNFGYECGLNIANYNDIKIGDLVEAYEEVEVKKTL